MTTLLEPFAYSYMVNAMWVSALVGSDPFSINAGLLKGQPVELETAIRQWLVKSNA